MWFFIARRVLYAVPILLGASLVVFVLMKMVPGDAADVLIPPEAGKEVADMIRARFGLDQPIHIQYLRWLQAMASGDFGVSIFTNQPVAEELFGALVNTLKLALSEVRALRPIEVRTAVSFKTGEYNPDFFAFATEKLIILPWDREILVDGVLAPNPLYADALEQQEES